jgi:hypothetical protein
MTDEKLLKRFDSINQNGAEIEEDFVKGGMKM